MKNSKILNKVKMWGKALKGNIASLYLAYKDKRTPWYAKIFAAITVGYALSPIDLIPDFIPVLGYVDDAILLPVLIFISIKLIPYQVWSECKEKAENLFKNGKPKSITAAIIIIIIWLLIIGTILFKILV